MTVKFDQCCIDVTKVTTHSLYAISKTNVIMLQCIHWLKKEKNMYRKGLIKER